MRSSSVRSLAFLPSPSSTGALGAATLRLLSHFHEAVLRARDRPLDEQEVLLGIDRMDGQADLRDAFAAEAAGHLDSLEDPRRRRGRAYRARLADVVRAVRGRATAEVVPLDRAGEALPDRDARNLDAVAGLEALDGDGLALGRPGQIPELQQVPVRAHAVLAELAGLRLREPLLRDLLECDLNGVVAVDAGLLDRDDRARPRLDHRHRRHLTGLLVEDLGHAQLPAHDPFHLATSLTRAGGCVRVSGPVEGAW